MNSTPTHPIGRHHKGKGKGRPVPCHCRHTGKVLYPFSTSALDEGWWLCKSQPLYHPPPPPRGFEGTEEKKFLPPTGVRTPEVSRQYRVAIPTAPPRPRTRRHYIWKQRAAASDLQTPVSHICDGHLRPLSCRPMEGSLYGRQGEVLHTVQQNGKVRGHDC